MALLEFKRTSLVKRILLSKKILSNYPDRVPIIITMNENDFPKIKKVKYLAPQEATLSRLKAEIHRQFKHDPPIFYLTANSQMLTITMTTEQVYQQYANVDGFLYIHLIRENSFGNY